MKKIVFVFAAVIALTLVSCSGNRNPQEDFKNMEQELLDKAKDLKNINEATAFLGGEEWNAITNKYHEMYSNSSQEEAEQWKKQIDDNLESLTKKINDCALKNEAEAAIKTLKEEYNIDVKSTDDILKNAELAAKNLSSIDKEWADGEENKVIDLLMAAYTNGLLIKCNNQEEEDKILDDFGEAWKKAYK